MGRTMADRWSWRAASGPERVACVVCVTLMGALFAAAMLVVGVALGALWHLLRVVWLW